MPDATLKIDSIVLKQSSLDATVSLGRVERSHVTSAVARKVSELLPTILDHVCVSGQNETFGDDLEGTETAHLLEHLTIELMAQSGSDMVLTGHTSWTGNRGVYRVSVNFDDDLVALGALKAAVSIIDWTFSEALTPSPDIAGISQELQILRNRPARFHFGNAVS